MFQITAQEAQELSELSNKPLEEVLELAEKQIRIAASLGQRCIMIIEDDLLHTQKYVEEAQRLMEEKGFQVDIEKRKSNTMKFDSLIKYFIKISW